MYKESARFSADVASCQRSRSSAESSWTSGLSRRVCRAGRPLIVLDVAFVLLCWISTICWPVAIVPNLANPRVGLRAPTALGCSLDPLLLLFLAQHQHTGEIRCRQEPRLVLQPRSAALGVLQVLRELSLLSAHLLLCLQQGIDLPGHTCRCRWDGLRRRQSAQHRGGRSRHRLRARCGPRRARRLRSRSVRHGRRVLGTSS